MQTVTGTAEVPATPRWRPAVVIGVGLLMFALVMAHVKWVNGPWYWTWPWRRLGALGVYPAMLAAALPFFAGQWLHARHPSRWRAGLALAALSAMAIMLVGVTRTGGLERVVEIIHHPLTTSYWTDAVRIHESGAATGLQWLRWYPELMPQFHLHALTKPPAPVLYYLAFAGALGANQTAALAAGLLLAPLAALSIPATFALVRHVTGREEAAFHAASLLALCPGYVLFFPEFDQLYPVLACALWLAWARAVDGGRAGMAAAFGAVLALVCFTSYSLLVLGTVLLGYAVLRIVEGRTTVGQVVRLGAVSIGTFVVINALLWIVLRYDAVAVFAQALRNQERLLEEIARPYPATVLWDLWDFALGAAWTGAALALLWLARGPRGSAGERSAWWVSALCAGQLVLVAIIALLPGETARVWIFMLPLLVLPAGLELARWTPRARMLAYAATWLVTAAILQNMQFIA